MNTPTPRTDKVINEMGGILIISRREGTIDSFQDTTTTTEVIPSSFARQLERELSEANARAEAYREIARELLRFVDMDYENDKFGKVSRLRQELEQLEAEHLPAAKNPQLSCPHGVYLWDGAAGDYYCPSCKLHFPKGELLSHHNA